MSEGTRGVVGAAEGSVAAARAERSGGGWGGR